MPVDYGLNCYFYLKSTEYSERLMLDDFLTGL